MADEHTTAADHDSPLAHLPPAAIGLPLRRLSGPDTGIITTPRFPTPGPDEICIRLIRKPEGMIVHITAPNPEIADAVVRKCFGDNQPYTIELCG
ncbi:MAG: hypothetical protein AB7K09_06360 [Planctomycetota bacterium]